MNKSLRQLVIALSVLLTVPVTAQEEIQRSYYTLSYLDQLKLEQPSIIDSIRSFERYNHRFMRFGTVEPKTIPLVFHLITPPGTSMVTPEDVLLQIEQLNLHFSGDTAYDTELANAANEAYGELAVDTEIQFCLPLLSPLGLPTTGILPKTVSVPFDTDEPNLLKTAELGALPWNPQKYLNIWITPLPDSISGFAQMPGAGLATDGIVIDPRYIFSAVGESPYGQGKTLTHLIGSYLGLLPLWGKNPCGDDYLTDTPIHNDPNYGIPTGRHITTCGEYEVEMLINFMDNTDDEVQWMFTPDQKRRMHAALSEGGARGELGNVELQCDLLPEPPSFTENIEDNGSTVEYQAQLRVFPNPVRHTIQLEINYEREQLITLSILSQDGHLIDRFDKHYTPGDLPIELDVSKYPSGIYSVSTPVGDDLLVEKFIVID